MADDIRQQIVTTALTRRDGGEESYAGHLKIWEEDEGGRKSRFIILSYDRNGRGYLHKSKQNPSGSFSIGKTWKLEDLRALEVEDPNSIRITLSRPYRWRTERERDQLAFLDSIVELHRRVTNNAPLSLGGFTPSSGSSSQSVPRAYTPTPSTANPAVAASPRRQPQIRSPPEDPYSQNKPVSPPPARDRLQGRPYANLGVSGSSHSINSLNQSPSASSSRTYDERSTPRVKERGLGVNSNGGRAPSQARSDRKPSMENAKLSFDYSGERDFDRDAVELEIRREAEFERETERLLEEEGEQIRLQQEERERELMRQQQEAIEQMEQETAIQDSQMQVDPQPPQVYIEKPKDRGREPLADRLKNGFASRSTSQAATISAARTDDQLRPPSPPPVARQPSPKRDPNARISFFDPANQAMADRLLFGSSEGLGGMGDDDPAEATLANVEEMLEGIEWGFAGGYGTGASKKGRRGAADMIEARLLDELMALEKANIHSFLESDDRVAIVLKYIDDAIKELDEMDGFISTYKIHLNAVSDDISHIQSQDRGLQVQTQNQKALLGELERLMQTVEVDRGALIALTQESLESSKGIQKLETAAAELYKALIAGRETAMAASMERLDEYRTHNAQFCKRLLDFLNIAFKFKSDKSDSQKAAKATPTLVPHKELEDYLGRYCGLMLYLKEMDEERYAKVCSTYFATASELHGKEMKAVLMAYINLIKPADTEGELTSFNPPVAVNAVSRTRGTIRRAKTIARSVADRRDRTKVVVGELSATDALLQLLDLLIPQIFREQDFLADFLQITDASLTFADYMGLENYFRRQSAASAGDLRLSTVKLIRGAMDSIFGFLMDEVRNWTDAALQRDPQQVVGLIATIEQVLTQAEERGSPFVQKLLSKQHQRIIGLYGRHIDEQVKAIERTKLSTKKRNGVAHFIKYFPIYVEKVEGQLAGFENLEVRTIVEATYEKIIQTMLECLQQMAKMDGPEGQMAEDKGMLNYHVILIENMEYFVSEMSQLDIPALATFVKRAKSMYDDNLDAYVKIVLRKPFGKLMDFFDGVDRLLQAITPAEVANSNAYNRSALKRVVKDFNSKDVRKNIEGLFKRVEKHFDDEGDMVNAATMKVVNGTVMETVWRACEEQLVKETQRFIRLIGQCYADSGVMLEYSVMDVEGAFKRHRT
ncbi:hypothetical protein FRB99_008637 [Tulasnella sp. 403]|nr:hypothetical protein FRB99_008637 [Tulasnella sp. 403]